MDNFVSKRGWWLLLSLLGQPTYGAPGTPYVTFINGNDPQVVTNYRISDDDLRKEIAVLTPNSYTEVYVRSTRHLQIAYQVPSLLLGGWSRWETAKFTVTPDMAGKVFALTNTHKLWADPQAVEQEPTDLSGLAYFPDVTGILTLGRSLSPYEQTYDFLVRKREWDAVSTSSQPLEPAQRAVLYDRFKLDPQLGAANIFPGIGWGSFSEGDWVAGGLILVGESASLAGVMGSGLILMLEFAIVPFSGDAVTFHNRDIAIRQTGTFFVVSLLAWVAVKVAAVSRGYTYPAEFNHHLADSLGLKPE